MQVSSEGVKKFLHDIIQQTNFPGHMAEFVSEVKREIVDAKIESITSVDQGGEIDGTASARMISHK